MSCEGLRTWNIFTVCDGFISSRAIVVQSRDQMLLALWAQSLQIHTRHIVQNRRYHRAKVVTRSSRLKQICRIHLLCVHARMSYPSCVSQQMCIQEQLFQDGRVKAGGNAFPIKNPQCVGKKKKSLAGRFRNIWCSALFPPSACECGCSCADLQPQSHNVRHTD